MKADGPPQSPPAAPARVAALWGQMGRDICAGLTATGIDFIFYNALVEGLEVIPARASVCGCVLGGLINFVLNRLWTYQSLSPMAGQAARYAFTSGTGAALNGLTMTLLAHFAWPHQLRWALTQGLVWAGWNFPMHRYFVFGGHSFFASAKGPKKTRKTLAVR